MRTLVSSLTVRSVTHALLKLFLNCIPSDSMSFTVMPSTVTVRFLITPSPTESVSFAAALTVNFTTSLPHRSKVTLEEMVAASVTSAISLTSAPSAAAFRAVCRAL